MLHWLSSKSHESFVFLISFIIVLMVCILFVSTDIANRYKKLFIDIAGILDLLSQALQERKGFETDVSKLEQWLQSAEPVATQTVELHATLEHLQQTLNVLQVLIVFHLT